MTVFEKALQKFQPLPEEGSDAIISMTLRNYSALARFIWNAALDTAIENHESYIYIPDTEKIRVGDTEI